MLPEFTPRLPYAVHHQSYIRQTLFCFKGLFLAKTIRNQFSIDTLDKQREVMQVIEGFIAIEENKIEKLEEEECRGSAGEIR